jgi:lipopolysaccharide export system protein LptA
MKNLIGSLFLLFIILLNAERQELRPYRLINADTLFIEKVKEEYVSFLKGNVHFFYGETEFFSDRAEVFEKQKITKLIGNVKVFDDTLSLRAHKADYFRNDDVLHLQKDVFVREDHVDGSYRTFEAQKVKYDRKNRHLFATDHVRAFDEKEHFKGVCGELTYDIENGYGYLIKKPIISIAKNDSMSISAEKIEYFHEFKKIAATFNVITKAKDFEVKSNFFLYFSQEEKGIYLGEPKFYSEFADASAREFQIYFEDEKIKKAILIDFCKILYKMEGGDKKENWVTSDEMKIDFEAGELTHATAIKNVNSYYFQPKKEKNDLAINVMKGEELVLFLNDNNKIDTIKVKRKISGKYKFEHK